jgi:hypothetical protein
MRSISLRELRRWHGFETGEDFVAACQALARDFRGPSTAEIGLSFPIERHIRSRQERRPFHELAARYAVPNEAN